MRIGREFKSWLAFAFLFLVLWIVAIAAIIFDAVENAPDNLDEFPDQALGMGPPSIFFTVLLLLPFTVSFVVSACGRFLFLTVANNLRNRKGG